MSGVLFEDIFEVGKLNPDGKKFDRGESGRRGQGDHVSAGWVLYVSGRLSWLSRRQTVLWLAVVVVVVPEQGMFQCDDAVPSRSMAQVTSDIPDSVDLYHV